MLVTSPNISRCFFPRVTESPRHLVWVVQLSESFSGGAEIQTCRYWTTQLQTLLQKTQVTEWGQTYCNNFRIFCWFVCLLPEERWQKVYWNKQIWVFTSCTSSIKQEFAWMSTNRFCEVWLKPVCTQVGERMWCTVNDCTVSGWLQLLDSGFNSELQYKQENISNLNMFLFKNLNQTIFC